MQFEVWTKGLATLAVDCIVLGIFEEGELSGEAQSVDSASSGKLKKLLARGDFPGRPGETLLLTDVPGIQASRVLLTGLGEVGGMGLAPAFGHQPGDCVCSVTIRVTLIFGHQPGDWLSSVTSRVNSSSCATVSAALS